MESGGAAEATPALLELVRELSGQLPTGVVCVDSRGLIHALALPVGTPPPASDPVGRRLDDLLPDAETALPEIRRQLSANGRARTRISVGSSGTLDQVDADVVLIDGTGDPSELAASWQALPSVIDAVPLALLGVDLAGRVCLLNEAGAKLLGYAQSELRGRRIEGLFDDPADGGDFFVGLFSGDAERVGAVLLREDGSQQKAELASRVLMGATGNPRGWIVSVQPSGEPTRRTLSRSEELERCIESLAHDLRTPLSAVRGFSSLLERECGANLEEPGQGYLRNLRENLDRADGVLRDLLEYFRTSEMERGQESVPCREIFSELATELKPMLGESNVELLIPVDPRRIYANPTRFRQVVLNLLLNALQHMGDVESPRIQIAVEASDFADILVVSDNGLGVPPEDRTRILEMFRSERAGVDWRGAGLGLSIVKRIVTAHGGHLELDSSAGEGAVFRAFFPRAPR